MIYRQSSALTNIKRSWSHTSIVYLELAWWVRSIIHLKLRAAATSIIHLKLRTAAASIIYLKLWTATTPIIHLKLRLLSFIHLKILMSPILLKIRAWCWPIINLEAIWRHCATIIIKILLCSFKILLLPYRYILWFLKIIFFIILAEIIIRSFVHIVRIAKTRFFIEAIILCFRYFFVSISIKYRKLLLLPYWVALLLVIDMIRIVWQRFF